MRNSQQMTLSQPSFPIFPEETHLYPQLRYMGNKYKLLPWIWETLVDLRFQSALDLFSGSGCVSYLFKRMGKRVIANDFLSFPHQLAKATVENSSEILSEADVHLLTRPHRGKPRFIETNFAGIFFAPTDLRFLDSVWANLDRLDWSEEKRALALAALVRSCMKRQPRGVFTVRGDAYDDGRRDLRLSIHEHFLESVQIFNRLVFDNRTRCSAVRTDALGLNSCEADLVYMDPPYVPRADDNCYIKRYHFLEGLSSYWRDEGTALLESSRVKKIPKRFTPFSYRRTAVEAFEALFARYRNSRIVLSYSSNGFPDLESLTTLLKRYKSTVDVHTREHKYHFGTHEKVSKTRTSVVEYLIVAS